MLRRTPSIKRPATLFAVTTLFRSVRSVRVLDAMRAVPREEFVPDNVREYAYQNSPLPIGSGQTISQPYIVAFMIEALELGGGETILAVGARSEEHTSELQSLMRISYAVFCLKKQTKVTYD